MGVLMWLMSLVALLHLVQGGTVTMMDFSEEDKQKIVDAHNDYRRLEEASDMDLLVSLTIKPIQLK